MGRRSGRFPRSRVRRHTFAPDPELSRGTRQVWCGTCGLPGDYGDARHYDRTYADEAAAELAARILGERA